MNTAAFKAYIRTLRQQRGVSQREIAETMGMAPRSYSHWETGEQDDLKALPFVRAIVRLGGSWSDVEELSKPGATEESARQMVSDLLHHQEEAKQRPDWPTDPDRRQQLARLLQMARDLVETAEPISEE